MNIQPYQPRPIRFLDLWQHGEWQIKVYGIAFRENSPTTELIEAAKSAARERLAASSSRTSHYSVGFLGVHQGRTSNFVFIDWWADENELHHHVYVSPSDKPACLTYVTPSGLVACVWDLRLMAFERQAWVDKVLRNPKGPHLEGYLEQRFNESV